MDKKTVDERIEELVDSYRKKLQKKKEALMGTAILNLRLFQLKTSFSVFHGITKVKRNIKDT
ncbi:MAG: hypothetical protein Ta2B_20360 [Termitinemataceae bacterium]|nr:MAG: hypothetical protein Ta2B_20360 [Termitinemataceae bacterium]